MTRSARFLLLTILLLTDFHADNRRVQAAPKASDWLEGSQLMRRLGEPIGPGGATWSGVALRKALAELSQTKKVAILLDRRVDPDQQLEMTVGAEPLKQVLFQIAEGRSMGVCLYGPVVYFGPLTAMMQVRTLAELRRDEVAKLPAAARTKFSARRPMAWVDFATPRDLLQKLADESGIRVANPERIPHDLWAAADLPPLSLIDRLTLIVGQFGLTFEVSPDGSVIRLMPIPEEVALVRSYPGGKDPQALAAKWAEALSPEQVKVVGDKVYVKGLLEEHERVASPEPETSTDTAGPTPIDKIRIDNLVVKNQPLQKVLDYVAQQLSLQLEIDHQAIRRAGISTDQLVTFGVKDASVDDLLEAMLRPVKLKFDRQGRTVKISPAR